MLNPRPYYSHNCFKSFFQHLDSSFRWRLNRFLLKAQGAITWISIEEFEKKYNAVVEKLLKKNINVLIVSTVHVSDKFFPGTNESYLNFNRIIHNISKKFEIPMIDLFGTLKNEDYMADMFHMNLVGYKKIAKMISDVIIYKNDKGEKDE